MRPVEFYLRLDKTRDVIEWQLDETLDINGWDLQKALRLLHGSNPTLFEWNNSPIVYKTTPEWGAISAVIDHFFQQKPDSTTTSIPPKQITGSISKATQSV